MAFDAEHTSHERASKMGTEALGATISALELWSRTLNNWMLICAAGVAIFLVAEATLLISHWLNQNRLSLLRAQQASFYAEELVKLRESADQEKQRAAKAELRAANAASALGARTLNTA